MRKLFKIGMILVISISIFCIPINTQAETLKDYQNLLQKYKDELNANNQELNKTEAQIAADQKEINAIVNEMKAMQKEAQQMREDIVKYNQEIKDKSLETKQLFEYLQLANGENAYLEYAFGAETITDFIYRLSVVEQMTEYNQKTIKNLEDLIEKNNQRQKDLEKKESDMENRQKSLNSRIESLTGMKAGLAENIVSKEQEVKNAQAIVDSYVKLGCKPNDVIGRDCAVTSTAGTFMRPIAQGYVTSEFGYRWGSLHRAVDVSNKDPFNTKIYPVANGTITSIYKDYYGALTVIIEHRLVSGKYYSSLYTHMSKYAPNIYVGKSVTTADYIGYMGETGYAYGPHLHLEIAPCRLYNVSDKNCRNWNSYVNYVTNLYNNGSFHGPRDLINFPKLGVNFYNR